MIEQLDSSIQFDCGGKYYKEIVDTKKQLSGKQWKQEKIQSCKDDINYHTKSYKEEVLRVTERNKWIENLYKSLPE